MSEKCELVWSGKKEMIKGISEPCNKKLVSCKSESIDFDNTKNILFEGDNYDVLKLVKNKLLNKVKMIYIDPPYNLVDDRSLLYKDDQKCGSWFNFMYERLSLGRELLREDGCIFISIDDKEVSGLRFMCDEIFGNENFTNEVCIKTNNLSKGSHARLIKFSKDFEYLLCYCKNIKKFEGYKNNTYYYNVSEENKNISTYNRVLFEGTREYHSTIKDGFGDDIKIYTHKDYKLKNINVIAKEEKITKKEAYIKYHDKIFRDMNAKTTIRKKIIDGCGGCGDIISIDYIPVSGKDKGKLTTKYFYGKNRYLFGWLKDITKIKKKELFKKEYLKKYWADITFSNLSKQGGVKFPNGKKPIALIQRLIRLSSSESKDDIILDFFAGSGSTGHAVMQQNSEDGGTRKFILVQKPEEIKKNNVTKKSDEQFDTIAEITKTRLRRSGREYKNIDTGFKLFKVK